MPPLTQTTMPPPLTVLPPGASKEGFWVVHAGGQIITAYPSEIEAARTAIERTARTAFMAWGETLHEALNVDHTDPFVSDEAINNLLNTEGQEGASIE